MASKFNTEFNYRYQVIGNTPWEKIKTLQGFLEGRLRAAEIAKLKHLKKTGLEHEVLELEAELLEEESFKQTEEECFKLNLDEIEILNKLLKELYVIAEPTRIKGYTDEEMYEANAANEFTVNIGREIQAEMIANGRPSAAKLRNAMSNPYTWNALKSVGLIPKETKMLEGNIDPLQITLKVAEDNNFFETEKTLIIDIKDRKKGISNVG
jgi:hypothetical protein